VPTIADVGITYPLIDTYLTHKSTEERGFAANKYGAKKNKDYRAIIKACTCACIRTSPPSLVASDRSSR
jgi:hypothetical protein